MRCATHHDVETNLRCGKCAKPICPKCLVETPVGARCWDCARLYKLPTYRVSPRHYLRAIGTTLGMAVVCGIIWVAISSFAPFYISPLVGAVIGYATGEVVSRSVNRKRGWGLAIVASLGVLASYAVTVLVSGGRLPFGLSHILLELLAVALGIYFAVNRLR